MKAIISTALILLVSNLFSQNTWYVRPAFSGQTYGTEDGTSYANAWNGLETLNGKFQDGTIGPTDEIYICGTHVFHDTTSNNPIALQGKIGIKSGLDSLHHLVIRGDYPGDPGVIWGHSRMDYEPWVNRGNNVWSIYVHAYYPWNLYLQDVETTGPDPDSIIVLDVVGSLEECRNTPGSTYSPTYVYDSMYVHLTDGGNPTNRVYARWFGYGFDFDNYINTFSPLHYITFKNLQLYGMGVSSNMAFTHCRWDGCTIWRDGIRFYKGQDYNEVISCDIGWCGNGVYGIDKSNEGGANHILIKGNHFHDIGVLSYQQNSDEHAVGVQGGTGWIIEDNYIERCGSGPLLYAFTNQRLTNFIIRRNFIKDCDEDGSATGYGIATQCNNNSFSDKSGNRIYNNIVVNCKVGIRLQFEDMQDCFNNTIYGCENSFVSGRNYDRKGARVDFKNNISVNPSQYHIQWYSGADTISMLSDYNLFDPDGEKFYWVYVPDFDNQRTFAQWQILNWDSCTFDPNGVLDTPFFVNATGTFSEPSDFKLSSSSPAIDAGTDVGLTTDFDGNPINGTPDIGAYEYQSPLSLEYLDDFNAIIIGEKVQLSWSTTSEINSDYFDIERTMDFKNWKIIGRIHSKGNASINSRYITYDTTPLNGTSYYRIKQVDIDGAFSYSKMATIHFKNNNFLIIRPNPANSVVELSFSKSIEGKIVLFNTLGKSVFQQKINSNQVRLDLSHLKAGTYYLGVKTNREVTTKKVILQK